MPRLYDFERGFVAKKKKISFSPGPWKIAILELQISSHQNSGKILLKQDCMSITNVQLIITQKLKDSKIRKW